MTKLEELVQGHNCAEYENHVAFWGSYFSNYHNCIFTYKEIQWKSSEQAYMAEKAIYFGDYSAFIEILNAPTPAEAKKIGRRVKNFDQEKWNKVSYDIMYNIVYAKFSRVKECKDALLLDEIRDKHFVEGSPVDAIWGVKIIWNDPRIDDEANWQGENRLGRILDAVRTALIEETKKES